MKIINKFNIILAAIVASIVFSSCVDNNDYTVPTIIGDEENTTLNAVLDSIQKGQLTLRTIKQVKDDFFTSRNATEVTQNIVVKGYVTSSDASGNFFREFYMQDSAENPTAGIKVIVNITNSNNQFNIGREVYIRLKGLYIGETRSGDNDATIGGFVENGGTELEAISENQIKKFSHVLRSQITEEIIPLPVKFSNISDDHLGLFVKVENAFFDDSLQGQTYFDPRQDFDTDRLIKSCDGFGLTEFTLATSSFANFGGVSLPTGGGTIKAIVTKNYDRELRLALNSVEDVDMQGTKCELLDINDFTEAFSEDFESATNPIALTGWTNYSEAGTRLWSSVNGGNSNNNRTRIASIGSFRSNDPSTISWLITPQIDLDATNNEFLTFESSNSFADGSELEVLISTDWDGTTNNIATATWDVLPAGVVADSVNFREWVSSGLVDLSNYSGNIHIAFKYVGSGNTSNDGTYEIDNVKILAQ